MESVYYVFFSFSIWELVFMAGNVWGEQMYTRPSFEATNSLPTDADKLNCDGQIMMMGDGQVLIILTLSSVSFSFFSHYTQPSWHPSWSLVPPLAHNLIIQSHYAVYSERTWDMFDLISLKFLSVAELLKWLFIQMTRQINLPTTRNCC